MLKAYVTALPTWEQKNRKEQEISGEQPHKGGPRAPLHMTTLAAPGLAY